MEKIDLPSGAILEIGLLPYEEAWKVQQKIALAIKGIEIDKNSIDFKNLWSTDVFVLKGAICQILGNDAVIQAAKECFKKCLYNNQKITNMTFDEKESRQDFLYCVAYALKANIEPFFAGLASILSTK
jgi:hypothetical protein